MANWKDAPDWANYKTKNIKTPWNCYWWLNKPITRPDGGFRGEKGEQLWRTDAGSDHTMYSGEVSHRPTLASINDEIQELREEIDTLRDKVSS